MKKTQIYVISIVIAIAFGGCSSRTSETYIAYKNVPMEQETAGQIVVKQEHIQKEVSGIIKGRVIELSYDAAEGLWDYSVESKDTSNGKLSSAKFTHKTAIAKKGDLVYAFISDGRLKEFYLMEKAKYISAKKQSPVQKQPVVTHKSIKRDPTPMEVPSSELILLN